MTGAVELWDWVVAGGARIVNAVDIPLLPTLIVVGAVAALEVTSQRKLGVSPVYTLTAGALAIVEFLHSARPNRVISGREQFQSGYGDVVRLQFARGWEALTGESDALAVDRVDRRDGGGPVRPVLDPETSTLLTGETGYGKSTFVKSRLDQWEYDGAVVAHALSERAGENEFIDYFEGCDRDVIRLSSRDSDARWDPFCDYEQSPRGMESLAQALYESRETQQTGWDEPAKTLLAASLAVANTKYGDFAALKRVLARPPDEIITEVGKVEGTELLGATLRELNQETLSTVYNALLNELRPLLQSDIVNEDLPAFSLQEYFANPDGAVIVLDNIRTDKFARPFWRLLIQTAGGIGFQTEGRQQFILDEVDKLPKINNLPELVSAGRSADVQAMVITQDKHQLTHIYGELAGSILANCPNNVAFHPGDRETADWVRNKIGEIEVLTQDRAESRRQDEASEQSITRRIEEKHPITTGDVMDLGQGKALVQSRHGWWICSLQEQP